MDKPTLTLTTVHTGALPPGIVEFEVSNDDIKMARDLATIEDWFVYHAPDARQAHLLEEARAQFRGLATWLAANVADSRERAIALTDMRKVAMTVNQAIIFDRGER